MTIAFRINKIQNYVSKNSTNILILQTHTDTIGKFQSQLRDEVVVIHICETLNYF